MRSLGDIAKIHIFSRFEGHGGKVNFACNLLSLKANSIKI